MRLVRPSARLRLVRRASNSYIARVNEDRGFDLGVSAEPHPRLRFAAFETAFTAPLGTLPAAPWLLALLRPDAPAPFAPDDAIRAAIRDMLRLSGYKPTGRGKPASEYLLRTASEAGIGSINPAVDVCNAVSLHSGLPISVVDLAHATPPFHVRVAAPGERYLFNASGQEIDLEGLVCLCDAAGPCGNAVKDAQRTKTSAATQTHAVYPLGFGRSGRSAGGGRRLVSRTARTRRCCFAAPRRRALGQRACVIAAHSGSGGPFSRIRNRSHSRPRRTSNSASATNGSVFTSMSRPP